MDGNGRWAQRQGLMRIEGHRVGVHVVKDIIRCCLARDIPVLSLFAFSCENWARPSHEVEFLMSLFLQALEKEIDALHQQGVRLKFIGDRLKFSQELRAQMQVSEDLTQHNDRLVLNMAMNYSGQWDIIQAARCLAVEVEQGLLKVHQIDEQNFNARLATHDLPAPDLLIRTSGEQRLSNFFLWQLSFTELYFTEVLWPDFNETEFQKALDFYTLRERRYGKTSDQLKELNHV